MRYEQLQGKAQTLLDGFVSEHGRYPTSIEFVELIGPLAEAEAQRIVWEIILFGRARI